MQLNERSNHLLWEITMNPHLKSEDLENKYNLNRRQLKYSFNQINDWLEFRNLPKIERTTQGMFVIDPVLVSTLYKKEHQPQDMTIPSEKERTNIIILMLLTKEGELSLFHFTDELDVSKNTVLNDLKKAQSIVAEYELEINYTRQSGYRVEGKEFFIRKLLLNTIYKMLDLHLGKQKIEQFSEVDIQEMEAINERIKRIEYNLNLQFTDEKITSMPYILYFTLRRIQQGNHIDPFYIQLEELQDTKECKATEEILFDYHDIPMQERLFITLHLLTSNVYWSEDLTEKTIPDLQQSLRDMLLQFEKRSCIYLKDKEQLLNKLLLHMKPAYYRIKYKLTGFYDIQQTVSEEFKELHHIVKQSTNPLEKLVGELIPESEITYLTMLIGGWLTKQGDSIQQKVKALIVCPKGVSFSRLLLTELKDLFPEFIFLDSLSVRDFQDYSLDFDIVFSPVYLETEKNLFIVADVLSKEEKNRLRKHVLAEVHGYHIQGLDMEQMMEIIEKHAKIGSKQALKKDLQAYMNPEFPDKEMSSEATPHLHEFLHKRTIQLHSHAETWEEAVKESAKPLLENGSIEWSYVEALLQQHTEDPYIVIGPGIAIPHASPEEGVNDVSMSLLQLPKGVSYANNTIHVIVVIAALDKYQHLKALRQLMKLSNNNEDIESIMTSNKVQDVQSVIQKYSIETEKSE
ncbi:BglG family transcription antiterminator [Pontibacillus yanchengensis]|uniref:Ascorbate-specific PTS system EIIA component n=1 Tax=Pontibacillus yanchengensis Y32 TaxID=1385514 RepID=A0A0A2TDB7_9BACI|nr:BglG family transcription antiterminator [Pontibacillus yanchengensis]KGP72388.1 transcription antiterminator BglG [Pontibacillus yanchengensis Y32]